MSMISQSTQDSGSTSIDSEPRFNFRARYYDSLDSVQQRLDYSKPIPEVQLRKQEVQKPQVIKPSYIIVISAIIICILSSLLMLQLYSKPECDNNAIAPISNKYSIEKLFDPVQANYIKSYEESAVGKYFYWDLLAEQYFKMIVEQLKQVVWMEEEVIEQYFDHKFTNRDSPIIKKKVWRLRDKCKDIEVTTNISNKVIWRYKNCFCL